MPALSPLINVPISRQDSVIDVVSKGDGSHEADEVFVTTTILLQQDLDPSQDVTLILPMGMEAAQKPLLRYLADDIQTNAFSFDPVDRSVYDQAVADALGGLDTAQREAEQRLADAISQAAGSFSQAVLAVRPGQRQLRFFFTIAARRVEERTFEFQLLGPLASFVIQPGGSISVVAIQPQNTTLVEAIGLQDPTNPGSALGQTEADLGGRHCIGWFWRNDPLFRVRYRY